MNTLHRTLALPVSLIALVAIMAAGCSGPPERGRALPPEAQPVEDGYQTAEQHLYHLFQEWKGSPYRSGGTARSGVDCSGFVLRAYKDRFAIDLPRTVRLQAKAGRAVSRRNLRAGDLLFFKTGLFQRHVGLYLEGHSFMHASTKRGVTMASLENEYWSRRFWKARRLLD